MNKLPLFAATLSVAALGSLSVALSPAARADDSNPPAATVAPAIPPTSVTTTDSTNATTTSVSATSSSAALPAAQDKPVVVPSDTTGKPVVVVPMKASAGDMWKAQWAYRNLDEREVKRYRAMGFSDGTIRGAANISMRTGVSVEYVLRQIREMGMPLAYIASEDGLSTAQVNADIPGYGLETISVMTTPPTPPSAPMMNRSGMTSSYDSTTTTASNTTTGTSSSAALPGSLPSASPAAASGTVVDIAMGNPDFSTLVSALKAADLVTMLQVPGPFTVFAPTNAAFAKLPAGTLDNLLKPENKDQLRALLQYHVVPGRIMASDIMAMTNPSTPRTESGSTLNVKTTAPIMVNNANVTATDITASNGVIHVVDTVLMPPSADVGAAPAPAAAVPAPAPAPDAGTPAPAAPAPAAPATPDAGTPAPAAPATPAPAAP